MWGGYRIGARLLGYEVTVRPAGIEGEGGCVCVCVSEGGRYGQAGRGMKFFPPQLDLYVSGMNLGQDTGSGV